MRAFSAMLALVLVLPSAATARQITFPLVVDYALLGAALARQLEHDAPGGVLWGSPNGCRSLIVSDVAVGLIDTRIRIEMRGNARVGLSFLGFCFAPVRWHGFLRSYATPSVSAGWQLGFRDLDSELLDADRRRTTVASRVWDLVKDRVEVELGGFSYDLSPPVADVQGLVRASAGRDSAVQIARALAGLRPLRTSAGPDGVTVTAALDVPDVLRPEPSEPEPALGALELARWQASLESWDAFLVFVVKDLGTVARRPAVRDDLFDLLMRSRQELLVVLAGGPQEGADPVRRLFLDTWNGLRAIVREAALHGDLDARAARYLTFVTAGDALAAIDAAAPSLGLEISSDGLRRLARVLQPDYAGDPLAYSEAPDPTLREMFRFHEPPPLGEPPDPDGPPSTWNWPGLRSAYAEPPLTDLGVLLKRLDRWVPKPDALEEYRDAVAKLLAGVADRTGRLNALEPRFVELYPNVVRTTAWQESCWRQFVARNGSVTYLVSKSGDIGIMQVNRRVWRGLFDVTKLQWDIGYNAGAGAEILAQLLSRYGVREAGTGLENVARATYSAYNGGPSAYRRYRRARVPRVLRAIDDAFWEKYRAMAGGRALDFVLCIQDWPPPRPTQLSTVPADSTPNRSISSRRSRATATSPSRHSASAFRPSASFG